MRKLFCHPSWTADSLCLIPTSIKGGTQTSITKWCQDTYNTDTCYNTYTDAFTHALSFAESVILAQTIVSVCIVAIIFMAIFLCYRVLTAPVITESMNDIINYLLVLPISAAFGLTWYMWPWRYEDDYCYYILYCVYMRI